MISVKADFALGVILVGLLSALTACARHTQIPTYGQTAQAGEVKPRTTTNGISTTNGTTSTQELVPVSVPTTVPNGPASTAEPSTTTVRPPGNADDPSAVIDWLLDSSRRGR